MSHAGSNSNKTSDFDFGDLRQEDIDEDLNLMVKKTFVFCIKKYEQIKQYGLFFL